MDLVIYKLAREILSEEKINGKNKYNNIILIKNLNYLVVPLYFLLLQSNYI